MRKDGSSNICRTLCPKNGRGEDVGNYRSFRTVDIPELLLETLTRLPPSTPESPPTTPGLPSPVPEGKERDREGRVYPQPLNLDPSIFPEGRGQEGRQNNFHLPSPGFPGPSPVVLSSRLSPSLTGTRHRPVNGRTSQSKRGGRGSTFSESYVDQVGT